MPALLPPKYPLCNDSIDSNTDSDANIVPPEEDHIASRVGRRHRQGNSLLLSYAHHVASLVLPAQKTQRDELAVDLAEFIDPIAAGDPGSDPTPFLPEPSGLYKVLKQPIATHRPWIQSLVKELKGLVKDRGAFKKEQPGRNHTVVPVKEVFKCKLDQHGNVGKLKARIVFRGDLYTPTTHINSWNPHARWPSLQLYLALCAKFGIFPSQADYVMAYLQVDMKEQYRVRRVIRDSQGVQTYASPWSSTLSGPAAFVASSPLIFSPGFDLLPRCYQVTACHDAPRGQSRCCQSKLRLVLQFIIWQL